MDEYKFGLVILVLVAALVVLFFPAHQHTFSRDWDIEPMDLNFQGLDFGIGYINFQWEYGNSGNERIIKKTTIAYEESIFVWLVRESGIVGLP